MKKIIAATTLLFLAGCSAEPAPEPTQSHRELLPGEVQRLKTNTDCAQLSVKFHAYADAHARWQKDGNLAKADDMATYSKAASDRMKELGCIND